MLELTLKQFLSWLFLVLCTGYLFWEFFLRHNPAFRSQSANSLPDESFFVVSVDDHSVSYQHPSGAIETIDWSDLRCVEIVTTDQGPFLPDVFWVLTGKENERCTIAQGARGEETLIDHLLNLPGFDNESMIRAMGSVSNERFLCWTHEATQETA